MVQAGIFSALTGVAIPGALPPRLLRTPPYETVTDACALARNADSASQHSLCLSCGARLVYQRKVEFREDLKALFEKAAVGGKPVTFLFNDNQVRHCGEETSKQVE